MPVAASLGVGILLKWRWPAGGAFLVVFALVAPHDPAAGPVLQREVNLILALALGPLTAIAVAFALQSMDASMRTAADVEAVLGLPLLGLVPAAPAKAVKGVPPLLNPSVPRSFSESIRGLRSAVMCAPAVGAPRRVVVTSTAPGEGKSVVSSNLAESLGHAEQRTLLIDGDMRRPRVHEMFACAPAPGLSEILSGTVDVGVAIRATANPYLSVLPAGQLRADPATLLRPFEYARLLDQLGKDFDWVVVDAPPVLAATDAALMSDEASRVIFVVAADRTRPRDAQVALARLAHARARVLGAVLNRVARAEGQDYAWAHRSEYTQACSAHRL